MNDHEEAFLLLKNAPFMSVPMIRLRMRYLNKIGDCGTRKEGTIKNIEAPNIGSRLMAFEQYVTNKVNKLLLIIA